MKRTWRPHPIDRDEPGLTLRCRARHSWDGLRAISAETPGARPDPRRRLVCHESLGPKWPFDYGPP